MRDELKSRDGLADEEFLSRRKEQAIPPIISRLRSYAKQRHLLHTVEPKISEAIPYLLNQIDTIANYR